MRWLLFLVGTILSMPAAAQDWPNRTIRVIVPYPPGGPADIMGRLAAQKLQEKLGVTVVVENRSGASGTIGAEAVRQSPPDGYTFLAAPSVHVLGRQVVKSVPYDPVNDFTPIARYGEGPLLVLANPSAVQGKTIAEALPEIRARPKDFRFGLSALGAANHLAVLEFKTLLVDGDPQANSTTGVGFDLHNVTQSLYDCMVNEALAKDVILKTEIPNLDLIPSHIDLVGAEIEMINYPNREMVLKNIIDFNY